MSDVTTLAFAAAVAVLGILALGSLWLAARSLRATRVAADAARARHHELCAGFSELVAANAGLQKQLLQLAERVDRAVQPATPAPVAASVRAYDLAARLAAGGAASAELVANCGLTPAEAELAVLVHGVRPRAAATH